MSPTASWWSLSGLSTGCSCDDGSSARADGKLEEARLDEALEEACEDGDGKLEEARLEEASEEV